MRLRSKGCSSCRRRKVKCDLQTPQCRNCLRRNEKCSMPSSDRIFICYSAHPNPSTEAQSAPTREGYSLADERSNSEHTWRSFSIEESSVDACAADAVASTQPGDDSMAPLLSLRRSLSSSITNISAQLFLGRSDRIGFVSGLKGNPSVESLIRELHFVPDSSPAYSCMTSYATQCLATVSSDHQIHMQALENRSNALTHLRANLAGPIQAAPLELLQSVMLLSWSHALNPVEGPKVHMMHIQALENILKAVTFETLNDESHHLFLDSVRCIVAVSIMGFGMRVPFPSESRAFDFDSLAIVQGWDHNHALCQSLATASYLVAECKDQLSILTCQSVIADAAIKILIRANRFLQKLRSTIELVRSTLGAEIVYTWLPEADMNFARTSPLWTKEITVFKDAHSASLYLLWLLAEINVMLVMHRCGACLNQLNLHKIPQLREIESPASIARHIQNSIDATCAVIPVMLQSVKWPGKIPDFLAHLRDLSVPHDRADPLSAVMFLNRLSYVKSVPLLQKSWLRARIEAVAANLAVPIARFYCNSSTKEDSVARNKFIVP